MTLQMRKLAAGIVALAALTLPAFAADMSSPAGASPVGTWQSSTGESRYQVSLCGDDGTELCAKLTWLRADARTAENLAYLNKWVVKAHATQANKWRGTVNYQGDTVSGSVTLVDEDTLKLSGCKGIFCKSLRFTRV